MARPYNKYEKVIKHDASFDSFKELKAWERGMAIVGGSISHTIPGQYPSIQWILKWETRETYFGT